MASVDERARLFVALELPQEARDALVAWRARAVDLVEAVRLVPAKYLHVTLCFLGWRWSSEVEAIGTACATVGDGGTVELGLGEPVALPRGRPRALAVSLEDLGGGLGVLQAALSDALTAGGWYEPEERPFFGHVTVARAGRRARIPRGALTAPPPPRLRFIASCVVLYRSRLHAEGASYEAIARVALRPG
ncbi:MAG TPA: RNA 2',3'-cyclic phosphodiesterase [Solirubrobacteraceae bacterium]